MAEIICAVYMITNTITKDFYIGSSKNIKQRWAEHKSQSTWKRHPNNPMYLDFQKYGLDEFDYVGGANIAGATIVINEMVNE